MVGLGKNWRWEVAARHLTKAGASVVVFLSWDPSYLRKIPAHQGGTFLWMEVRCVG